MSKAVLVMDKKEIIGEMYALALQPNVDGRTFYHIMQAIMEMFKSID